MLLRPPTVSGGRQWSEHQMRRTKGYLHTMTYHFGGPRDRSSAIYARAEGRSFLAHFPITQTGLVHIRCCGNICTHESTQPRYVVLKEPPFSYGTQLNPHRLSFYLQKRIKLSKRRTRSGKTKRKEKNRTQKELLNPRIPMMMIMLMMMMRQWPAGRPITALVLRNWYL
jgi:hypothetical protein